MSEVQTEDRRHSPDRRLRDRRNGPKIMCQVCGSRQSVVLPDSYNSGAMDGGYRRVRRCLNCHTKFTTLEVYEGILPVR